MTTRNLDVTVDPTNIVTGLSLQVGQDYTVQNVDSNGRIFIREAAVKPTGGALRGWVLHPNGGEGTVTPETGIGVWVWTDRADGCKGLIGEAR